MAAIFITAAMRTRIPLRLLLRINKRKEEKQKSHYFPLDIFSRILHSILITSIHRDSSLHSLRFSSRSTETRSCSGRTISLPRDCIPVMDSNVLWHCAGEEIRCFLQGTSLSRCFHEVYTLQKKAYGMDV
jgi:hypothetical protein